MNFDASQIAPPKNWQAFESLCLAIFRSVWEHPTATKNGRLGQPQYGTDISGIPVYADGKWHGVQCKGKDSRLKSKVTKAEIDAEVAKAEAFSPSLGHWTLATTGDKDSKIEQYVRELSDARVAEGKFPIEILAWDDLQSLIAQYPAVIDEFYPDQSQRVRRILELLEKTPVEEVQVKAHAAAASEVEEFLRLHTVSDPISLTIQRTGKGEELLDLGLDEVAAELVSGAALILEAQPGAGKTTTLYQIARFLAKKAPASIPLIVPLAEELRLDESLSVQIFSRPRLQAFGQDALNKLAQQGSVIFLCDGWNERSHRERSWLQMQFTKLRRDYPNSGLLVTTRVLSPLSIPDSTTFYLGGLSPEQQLELLSKDIGSNAAGLLAKAKRSGGLRGLIRNPFYLRALATIAPSGALPSTKEGIVSAFVRSYDEKSEHRDAVYRVLRGHHLEYLKDLAAKMASSGRASLAQADARATVTRTSDRLGMERQIEDRERPNISDALDVLVAHHLLVFMPDLAGKGSFSFQHQQITEWFASFALEGCILGTTAVASGENREALLKWLNRADIDEVILFAAQRLARGDEQKLKALANAIMLTFDVDIMLAAELIQVSPDTIWKLVGDRLAPRVIEMHDTSNRVLALRFMGRSGRPEFADYIWKAMEDENLYDTLSGRGRGWLIPSALGQNAVERASRLKPRLVRSLVWDFAYRGGDDGLSFATELAFQQAGSAEPIEAILEILSFEGTEGNTDNLWKRIPEKMWPLLAERVPLARAALHLRERLLAAKWKRVENLVGQDKFFALRELAKAGETIDERELIDLAIKTRFKEYWHGKEAVEFVSENYSDLFQQAAMEALASGADFVAYVSDHLKPAVEAGQVRVVETFKREAASGTRQTQAARALNRTSIGRLLAEVEAISAQTEGADDAKKHESYSGRHKLIDGLASANPEEVLEAIIGRNVSSAREVGDLSEIIFRLRSENRDEGSLPVSEALIDRLAAHIEGWSRYFETDDDELRRYGSDYVMAIKRIHRQKLLGAFRTALDYELRQNDKARISRQEWFKNGRKGHLVGSTSYTPIYRNAFASFDGPDTCELLLSVLEHPDFEVEAAFELIRFGAANRVIFPLFGRLSREELDTARKISRNPQSKVARAVRARIERHLEIGDPQDLAVAAKLATALVQMDYGDDPAPIYEAAERTPTVDMAYDLMHVMTMLGLRPPVARITKAFQENRQAFFGAAWVDMNNWWTLRRWLELLAMGDSPEAVVSLIAEIPPEYRQARNLREVSQALGLSTSKNATVALVTLSQLIPEMVGNHNWQQALLKQGDIEGARYFLEVIEAGNSEIEQAMGRYQAVNVAAAMVDKHEEVKADFIRRLKETGIGNRPIVAEIALKVVPPADVAGLVADMPNPEGALASALISSARELVLRREPIEGTNSYQEYPDDLGELRKDLFGLAQGKGPRARLAYRLLMAIEEQREHYGRPPGEPRHPHLESSKPWPMKEPEAS